MTDQQLQQVYLGAPCLITSAALAAYAFYVRRKTARLEVIELAALVGLVAGLSFLLDGYLGTNEGHGTWEWALADSLETFPVVFTIAYACRVQSRRYKAARYRRELRKLTGKAPYVLGALWAVSTALKTVAPYPLGDAHLPDPPRALFFEGIILVGDFFFASLAAFVFFAAARTDSPGAKARLQNFSAAVAMSLFAFESVVSVIYWAARIRRPDEQADFLALTISDVMFPLIVLESVSLFVAVTAYYSRADADKLSERMADFFGYGARISEILANAPVWKRGLSGPYACLLQAGREECLNLSPKEQRQADEAYRLAAILRHGPEGRASRSGASPGDELIELAKLCDEALGDPKLASRLPSPSGIGVVDVARSGVGGRAGADVRDVSLYQTYEVLRPILGVEDAHPVWAWAPSEGWVQLVCVALAEAALLSSGKGAAVLEGNAVPQRIRDGYELARAIVSSRRTV